MSTNPNFRFDATPDDESSKVASRLESECQRLKERSRALIQGYRDRLGRGAGDAGADDGNASRSRQRRDR